VTIPAAQYLAMRSVLRGALSGNYLGIANPSEGEMLGFFNQLFAESSGVSALSAAKQAAMSTAYRGVVSGNFPGISNPNDADVAAFFAQLQTDASGAAALSAARYAALKDVLRDVLSSNATVGNPTLADIISYFSGFFGFNGSFTSVISGSFQLVQFDIGLTYGGTLLASGTTPPVITLTGSIAGTPVPIRVECTLLGALGVWTGRVSFDGGSTFPQAFTSAATVPLTGAGSGLTLNIAAGSAAVDNVWLATCAGVADQSGNAKHYSNVTANQQPVITVGLNGKPGLLWDGANDSLTSALVLPQSSVTPFVMFCVVKSVTWGNLRPILSHAGGGYTLYQRGVSPALQASGSGFGSSSSALAVGTFGAVDLGFTNSASDYIRAGSGAPVTGTSAGTLAATGQVIGSDVGFGFPNTELLMLGYAPLQSMTAWRAAVTTMYGGTVAV